MSNGRAVEPAFYDGDQVDELFVPPTDGGPPRSTRAASGAAHRTEAIADDRRGPVEPGNPVLPAVVRSLSPRGRRTPARGTADQPGPARPAKESWAPTWPAPPAPAGLWNGAQESPADPGMHTGPTPLFDPDDTPDAPDDPGDPGGDGELGFTGPGAAGGDHHPRLHGSEVDDPGYDDPQSDDPRPDDSRSDDCQLDDSQLDDSQLDDSQLDDLRSDDGLDYGELDDLDDSHLDDSHLDDDGAGGDRFVARSDAGIPDTAFREGDSGRRDDAGPAVDHVTAMRRIAERRAADAPGNRPPSPGPGAVRRDPQPQAAGPGPETAAWLPPAGFGPQQWGDPGADPEQWPIERWDQQRWNVRPSGHERGASEPWAPDDPALAPVARPSRPRPTTSMPGSTAGRLTSDTVVLTRPQRPEAGWRRAVWELSGGRWNPGISDAERARADLLRRIRCPIRGSHQIAVISVKGGVGKTTVSACLGLTFAELRGDRVLAMDANPDLGTLADRLTGDTSVTVQHLLDHLSGETGISINDIEQFVSSAGRLQVLAGGQEPCNGQAFTRDEYEEAIAVLSRCYNIVITDSGTGVNHSAMEGTIAAADSVVIVGAPTVDAASRASMTLDWLAGIGHAELARRAVVAMSLDRSSREIDQKVIREHFAPRCRAVVEIPADPHLATGGHIELVRCRPATRDAFYELAAELADAFAGSSRPAAARAGGRS